MLDLFRRHATSWLIKVALFLIVIVFIFWGGYTYRSKQETQIARIDDHYISIADYNQTYNQMVEMYRRQLGEAFSEDMIRQFNLKQQALDMLINRYLLARAAKELGLNATQQEIQQKILQYPVFQRDGSFDQKQYLLVLQQNRLTPEAFEQQIATELTAQKVEDFIKRRVIVSEEDILAEYRSTNARIQLAYVAFDPKSYEPKVSLDEKAVQNYYQEKQDKYMAPEKRRFAYVLFKSDDYLKDVKVSEDEVRQYYEDHQDNYHKEEEVRARHILFSVKEDAPEEEVKKVQAEAEKVLEQAKKGEDFAELAKKYSKDPGTAKNGGDLGYFTREKMVEPFSDAAFALKPGEISGLVRTNFGFHIIKVEDVRPEKTSPLEEVKAEIETAIKKEKARDIAYKNSRDFSDVVYARRNMEKAAQADKLQVTRTAPLSQKDTITGLEPSSANILNTVFSLPENGVSDVIEVPEGFVVAQVESVQAPAVLPFDQVKQQVEKDYREEQARTMAQKQASEFLAAAVKMKDLDQAAKEQKVEVNKTDWFSRREPDKNLRLRGDSLGKVFELQESYAFPDSPLVDVQNRFIVCRLLGKQVPEENLAKERTSIAKRILMQKQNALWVSWLNEQRQRSRIEKYREL